MFKAVVRMEKEVMRQRLMINAGLHMPAYWKSSELSIASVKFPLIPKLRRVWIF